MVDFLETQSLDLHDAALSAALFELHDTAIDLVNDYQDSDLQLAIAHKHSANVQVNVEIFAQDDHAD